MKARTIVTLGLIALFVLAAVCANAAYDPNWTRPQTDSYSYHGLNERYVYGGDKGWIDNDSWDATSTEGTDCSDYAPRCLALPSYVGEHSNTGHPYNTDMFYNNPGSIPNIVTVADVNSLEAWDMWVYRVSNGGPSDHMGLFKDYSGSSIITREAQCTACGVVSLSRPKQNLIDWNTRYRRRADWGGTVAEDGPSSCSWGGDRLDVVSRGADELVKIKTWTAATGWSAWANLGCGTDFSPAICTWGSNRLDVFSVSDFDQKVKRLSWDGSAWTGWQVLDAVANSSVDATTWGVNRIDLSVRATGNNIYHKYTTNGGSTWSGWANLSYPTGGAASGPSIVSRAVNCVEVFVLSGNGKLYHKYSTNGGSTWSGWTGDGMGTTIFTSAPDVCSWASDRMDIVCRGTDNCVYHNWWDAGGWHTWEYLGGATEGSPSISTRIGFPGYLDVYMRNFSDGLYKKSYAGGAWTGWNYVGAYY